MKKEYEAYLNEPDSGDDVEYDEHWSQPSSHGQNKRPKVDKNVNPKNIVKHNKTNTLDSVTPVEDPIDFISSEANDSSKTSLNALNIVDIKPVTLFTIKNTHTGQLFPQKIITLAYLTTAKTSSYECRNGFASQVHLLLMHQQAPLASFCLIWSLAILFPLNQP